MAKKLLLSIDCNALGERIGYQFKKPITEFYLGDYLFWLGRAALELALCEYSVCFVSDYAKPGFPTTFQTERQKSFLVEFSKKENLFEENSSLSKAIIVKIIYSLIAIIFEDGGLNETRAAIWRLFELDLTKNSKLVAPKKATPFAEIEEKLDYRFSDVALLQSCLQRSSYRRNRGRPQMRFAFLGDRVLSLELRRILYEKYFGDFKGFDINRAASLLESNRVLCEVALERGFVPLTRGTYAKANGDLVEALIAAVFLDSNLEQVRKTLVHFMGNRLDMEWCNPFPLLRERYGLRRRAFDFSFVNDSKGKVCTCVLSVHGKEIGRASQSYNTRSDELGLQEYLKFAAARDALAK